MIKFNFKKYKHIRKHLAIMLVIQQHVNIVWYITKYLNANRIYISSRLVRRIIAKSSVTGKIGLLSNYIFKYILTDLNSTKNIKDKDVAK